jgi:hypothetical protein
LPSLVSSILAGIPITVGLRLIDHTPKVKGKCLETFHSFGAPWTDLAFANSRHHQQ